MGHDHQMPSAAIADDHSGHDHDHHDHGDHAEHGDHGSHMDHMMSMVVSFIHSLDSLSADLIQIFVRFQFHFGYKEVILIDQWSIDSIGGLIASMLVIFLMATFYEGLKYYREHLFWKTYNSLQYRAVTLPEKSAVVTSEENTRVQ